MKSLYPLIYAYFMLRQGMLVPNLTLSTFLTLGVRNGPNLHSYLFQEYTSLNPRRVKQNYTVYLKKMTETIYWFNIGKFKTYNKVRELFFDDSWLHFRTFPYFETITGFQLISRFLNISGFWDNYRNQCQCIYALT